jgi:hypothetical protein
MAAETQLQVIVVLQPVGVIALVSTGEHPHRKLTKAMFGLEVDEDLARVGVVGNGD